MVVSVLFKTKFGSAQISVPKVGIQMLETVLSTPVFFEAACDANPAAERNLAGSSLYVLRHISKVLKYVS